MKVLTTDKCSNHKSHYCPSNLDDYSWKTNLANNQELASQLSYARQKLLNSTIPFSLRALSYLRISCSVWRKVSNLEAESNFLASSKSPYLPLLKSLSQYKVEWWNDCELSDSGILRSQVRVIQSLLHPLTQLHQKYLNSSI